MQQVACERREDLHVSLCEYFGQRARCHCDVAMIAFDYGGWQGDPSLNVSRCWLLAVLAPGDDYYHSRCSCVTDRLDEFDDV